MGDSLDGTGDGTTMVDSMSTDDDDVTSPKKDDVTELIVYSRAD